MEEAKQPGRGRTLNFEVCHRHEGLNVPSIIRSHCRIAEAVSEEGHRALPFLTVGDARHVFCAEIVARRWVQDGLGDHDGRVANGERSVGLQLNFASSSFPTITCER